MTHAEAQQIRQLATFNGHVTRDQVRRLAQAWIDQHTAIDSLTDTSTALHAEGWRDAAARVRQIHTADAEGNCAHCTRGRLYPVPAPCGTVAALAEED